MKFLTTIWNTVRSFFKKENIKAILVLAAAILLFLLMRQCDRNRQLRADLEYERIKNDQNIAAMNEQVKVIQNLQGEMEFSKATYLGTIEEIRKYDSAMYERFRYQENLLAGIYADFSVKLDSILSKNDQSVQYDDSTYGIKFTTLYEEPDLFNRITGETKFNILKGNPFSVSPINTMIFSNEMRIGISYGFREYDDRYEVFAVSKSDKITFNELDGAFTLEKPGIVKEKKLRWGIGPQLGVTYNIENNKIQPYFGAGISYNFIRF